MSRAAAGSAPNSSKGRFWIFVILACCFLVFLMPTMFILVLAGMLPTWTAAFVERHGMGRVQVTAALNLAGVIPFLSQLWATDGSFRDLMELAGSVYTWVVMYGAAGAAIAYLWMGPYLAATYLDMKAARYTQFFERQRNLLLEDWGDALKPDANKEEKPDLT